MEEFFYELTFFHKNIEEYTYKIFDLGTNGLQVIDENTVKIFSYDKENIETLILNIENLGFKLKDKKKVKDENWIIKCPKELENLVIGKLKIVPTININDINKKEEQDNIANNNTKKDNNTSNIKDKASLNSPLASPLVNLKIIPGAAFGTGHHETTKNVLALLQHDKISENVKNNNIKNVLDIGTGSAILAIGTSLLYGVSYGVKVLAFDNDETTIENAKDNIRLNNLEDKITLFCGDISKVSKSFDLILANIYAEVLIDIYENLLKVCSKNAFLILSGIEEKKAKNIIKKYSRNFSIITQNTENGWTSILLNKAK
ncbi:MAG: 50S ribosomal protein L11 methyltransferase [Bdellovibrionota bacterium]